MILNNNDIAYISQRLATYPIIIYHEIYDEMLDHVISAIEARRGSGDEREIELLYNEVIETQFGGMKGITKLVLQNVSAYNKYTRRIFWLQFKKYLGFRNIVFIAILIAISFYLPQNSILVAGLLFITIITAAWSLLYIALKTKMGRDKMKKRSLARAYMISTAQYPTIFTFALVFIPALFRPSSHNPLHLSPFVYVVLIIFFVIYSLSTINLFRARFEQV